ncbi:hypothetical protein RB653_007862 [Dictyostelium firmibasis]|uniref:MRH domain-containing protein n=1 Tax=Dictyostelium firmibasis TaxID=79012 RepID=A0AAN7TW57_9MYCE
MNKFLILIILSTLSIVVVKSSIESCIFNNYNSTHYIDMSQLKNQSNNYPTNGFTFIFSVCSQNNFCLGKVKDEGVQSCQTTRNGDYEIGNINNGTYYFGVIESTGYSIGISYNSSIKSPMCFSGNSRSSNYYFYCSQEDIFKVISVYENPTCVFRISIKSKFACPIPIPTPTPSITPTPTPTPPITPTPSSNSSFSCELFQDSLIVKSNDFISCFSGGPTKCITFSGETCGTNNHDGSIKCTTPNSFINCTSNNIVCKTSKYSCSINPTLYSGLNVNNLIINSNYFSNNELN